VPALLERERACGRGSARCTQRKEGLLQRLFLDRMDVGQVLGELFVDRAGHDAVAKLDRDWAHLTAFYDFPDNWRHLRTSNAIESSFATAELRTCVTKGAGSK
jgi:hypothetical protein